MVRMGASTRDNRVLNRPLGRSLRSFARTAHSAHSLRSASLAHAIHGLAHSLRSLPRGTVEILEYMLTLRTRSMGINAIVVVTRNTPEVILMRLLRCIIKATWETLLRLWSINLWEE